jgi:transposase InsO family protein
MISFIEENRKAFGIEPICRVLKIAPSTFHALKPEIQRIFDDNFQVYGVRKVWRQMLREGFEVARCTVARLMKAMGLKGVIRGKPHRTTISDKALPCPFDRVNREFSATAPNVLWVADFTYVPTPSGFVYVAFVIDVFARKIVGWRASRAAHAGFVLDALEQAVCQRRPAGGLVHHSDRGNIFRSNTPSVSPTPASSHPPAASETATTTPLPKASTASSKPR